MLHRFTILNPLLNYSVTFSARRRRVRKPERSSFSYAL